MSVLSGGTSLVGVASAANTGITSCTTIETAGTHELAADIDVTQSDFTNRRSCIEINASDVILDGQGHAIDGYSDNTFDNNGFPDTIEGSTGVRVNGTASTPLTNVTVRDVDFENGNRGLNATHAPGIELTDLTVTDVDRQAIGVGQTDGAVTLQDIETVNSPSLPDGSLDMEPAVYLGSDADSTLPDRITVSNLYVSGTEYQKQSIFRSAAVVAATDDGPLSITDSTVTDTPRSGLNLGTLGSGFSGEDVDVSNLSVTAFDRIDNDGRGLFVDAAGEVTLNETSVTGGGTKENRSDYGIYIRSRNSDVTVANSTVRDLRSDEGVYLTVDGDSTVRNLTVHNNTYKQGLVASVGGTLDVDNVTLTETGEEWAGILSGNPAEIRNVTVADTDEGGLRISSFSDATTLEDATISNVGGGARLYTGLEVDTNEGTYRNVTVTDVAARGITVDETDDSFADQPLTLSNTSVRNVSSHGIDLVGGDLHEITNTTVVDTGGVGIRKQRDESTDVTLRNLSIEDSGTDGVRFREDTTLSAGDITMTNLSVTNASGNALNLTKSAATLTNFDLPSATLDATVRSVTVANVTATERPTPPSGKDDIGVHLEADNTTTAGYVDATVQYEGSDVPAAVDESTLSLWRKDGSWSEVGGTLDTSGNTVSANLTSFSVFAPLGETDTVSAANYDVTIDTTNSPVTEGETATVTATIDNRGTQQGTQDLTLSVGGTERDSQAVVLDAGNDTTVSLDWTTASGDEGGYTATVASENDSTTTTLRVDGDDQPDDSNPGGTGDSSGSGGGFSAGIGPGPDTTTEDGFDIDELPDVEEISDIVDGVAVFEETNSVAEVAFQDANASGTVRVEEYSDPPSTVVDSVTGAFGDEFELRAVADVTPSGEAERLGARVTFELSSDRIDADRAVVLHQTDDGWTRVQTAVDNRNATVAVSGRLESFSVVAVAEQSSSETTQTLTSTAETSPEGTPTPTISDETAADDTATPAADTSPDREDTSDAEQATATADTETDGESPTGTSGASGPGFGILIAVVAVVVAVLTRRRGT